MSNAAREALVKKLYNELEVQAWLCRTALVAKGEWERCTRNIKGANCGIVRMKDPEGVGRVLLMVGRAEDLTRTVERLKPAGEPTEVADEILHAVKARRVRTMIDVAEEDGVKPGGAQRVTRAGEQGFRVRSDGSIALPRNHG